MNVPKRKLIGVGRGISLVEVAVALAVVTLVSVATLSLIVSSLRVKNEAIDTMQAVNMAENAVECFCYANDEDECYSVLSVTDGRYRRLSPREYVLSIDRFTVNVSVDYDSGELCFSAVYDDGAEVYSISCKRGELP